MKKYNGKVIVTGERFLYVGEGETPEVGEEVIVNHDRVVVTALEQRLLATPKPTGSFAFKGIPMKASFKTKGISLIVLSFGDEGLLEASIEKWKYIVKTAEMDNLLVKDGGCNTCALCQEYYTDPGHVSLSSCDGCPVSIAGYPHCYNTPYDKYSSHRANHPAVALKAARDEVEFLESLR